MIIDANPETRTRRFQGVSYIKPIDAAKEAVPVVDLADRLCGPGGLRRVGKEWAGRCPLPDHKDRSPSFTVNPEKDVWFCHGCLRGGDVVTLAQLAWNYAERDSHIAAADLLHEFGHEIPRRPPAYFRKQERQKPIRDALEDVKARSAQRRLMRRLEPHLARIEDDAERRAEAFAVWDELEVPARLIVGGAN